MNWVGLHKHTKKQETWLQNGFIFEFQLLNAATHLVWISCVSREKITYKTILFLSSNSLGRFLYVQAILKNRNDCTINMYEVIKTILPIDMVTCTYS